MFSMDSVKNIPVLATAQADFVEAVVTEVLSQLCASALLRNITDVIVRHYDCISFSTAKVVGKPLSFDIIGILYFLKR